MTQRTIGVDISKAHLDAFRLEDGAAHRFENSAAGFRALQKWLGRAPIARIVFEPTGPYHKAFEAAFSKTFRLVKVNPLQARRLLKHAGPGPRPMLWMPECLPGWGLRSTLSLKRRVPRKPLFSGIYKLRVLD